MILFLSSLSQTGIHFVFNDNFKLHLWVLSQIIFEFNLVQAYLSF